ncbi:MAG: DNA recombination protein RmuC, partial [Bacteroidales bacterium]|nr:DNA recombination protein RmuC [Bacteroidales bacterium]
VVHLPGERIIILDSKVSLLAYDRYVNAETSGDRDSALQDHLLSVRRHVDELASKQYDRFDGSLDFTMMFIPVEPAYLTAIKTDSDLWSYAYSRRILLISPTNLIACLKLMSDLWSREMQSRNAMQIAERGALLYDKFVGFVNSLESIGSNLAKSQEAYTAAMKQLREGNGNLMGQALKLRELGVKANKVLEKKLPE